MDLSAPFLVPFAGLLFTVTVRAAGRARVVFERWRAVSDALEQPRGTRMAFISRRRAALSGDALKMVSPHRPLLVWCGMALLGLAYVILRNDDALAGEPFLHLLQLLLQLLVGLFLFGAATYGATLLTYRHGSGLARQCVRAQRRTNTRTSTEIP